MAKPAKQTEQVVTRIEEMASATVAEVLSRWPGAVAVFLRYRLACVGCSLSRFEVISDVAAVYGLDLACFVRELEEAAGISDRGRGHKPEEQGSKAE